MAKLTGLDHVGIAVKSISEARKTYEGLLGLKLIGEETVETEGVRVAFLELGGTRIELIEPLKPDTGVAKFIEKRGEGIHHICAKVEGLTEMLQDLKAKGAGLTNDVPRPGAHGKKIAFVLPKTTSGVLLELAE